MLNFDMRQRKQEISEVNGGIAYILWGLGLFGCCGIHRLYLGKTGSGILYLFTFGLFGLGQFIDLFFIPSMTQERNYYLQGKLRANNLMYSINVNEGLLRHQSNSSQNQKKELEPMLKLLKAAAANNNVLSIGQAIISLELPPEEVEKLLQKAVKQDLAHIDNDPETGAVRYHFDI